MNHDFYQNLRHGSLDHSAFNRYVKLQLEITRTSTPSLMRPPHLTTTFGSDPLVVALEGVYCILDKVAKIA